MNEKEIIKFLQCEAKPVVDVAIELANLTWKEEVAITLCGRKDMTQEAAAEEAGCSPDTMQRWYRKGMINPGAAVHGFGCSCCGRTIQLNGTNINLRDAGYYSVDVGATVSATAAGNITLSLYQDGVLVAQGSETIAAANDPVSISFPAGVKVNCSSVITLVVTSTAGDPIVTNFYTTVLKT